MRVNAALATVRTGSRGARSSNPTVDRHAINRPINSKPAPKEPCSAANEATSFQLFCTSFAHQSGTFAPIWQGVPPGRLSSGQVGIRFVVAGQRCRKQNAALVSGSHSDQLAECIERPSNAIDCRRLTAPGQALNASSTARESKTYVSAQLACPCVR